MKQQEQNIQVDPQKIINSLLRQLSDSQLRISMLECVIDQMNEAQEAASEQIP